MQQGVRRSWVGAACLVAAATLALPAEAEEAAPAPAAGVAAKDLVLLKNGGMLRGTISELVPDDYVVVVTVAGETKRYPMSQVRYAGPAERAPDGGGEAPPAQSSAGKRPDEVRPAITVQAGEARVRLVSDPPGQTFYKRVSTAMIVGAHSGIRAAGYDEICTAPCQATLPSGTHTLAMSEPGGGPAEAEPVTLPEGSSVLRGEYHSRKGLRVAGWITLIGGSMGGAV